MNKVFACIFALPLLAADPQDFRLWKGQELKAFDKILAAKMTSARKVSNQRLADFGNHNATIVHREGMGEFELHENWNDLMIIQTGAAELMVGGTITTPTTAAPGEIRGPSAEGAVKKMMEPGDVVHIPAGVPHQVLVAVGQQITYVQVKIPLK